MFCKKCGTKIDDDSHFCKACGAPQKAETPKLRRIMETCQIKGENQITKRTWGGDLRKTETWYEAWCGVTKIAESGRVEMVYGDGLFVRDTPLEDYKRACRESEQAMLDTLIADGWEPIIDPSTGEVRAMQREKR